jgi:hypothetical protein
MGERGAHACPAGACCNAHAVPCMTSRTAPVSNVRIGLTVELLRSQRLRLASSIGCRSQSAGSAACAHSAHSRGTPRPAPPRMALGFIRSARLVWSDTLYIAALAVSGG